MQDREKLDIHSEAFLHRLMQRQLRLSVTCAATFMIVVLGLPLANYCWPDLMATRVFGFTLTWLILGVLFFPFVWIISWLFIKKSIAMEEESSDLQIAKGRGGEREKGRTTTGVP